MLYKHWKKIALALTGFFWASCDNTSSAEDDSNESSSSSAIDTPTSSTGGETLNSSSSAEEPPTSSSADTPNATSSDDNGKSSSSMGLIAPKYGVPVSSSSEIAAKYGVPVSSSSEIAAKYGVPISSSSMVAAKYGVMMFTCERNGSKIVCEDGLTCTENVKETVQSPECEGDVCAKYGVVILSDTTYKCSDGKTYSVEEFRNKYNILDGAVDLYGCPSDICGPDTLIEEQPLYGVSNTISRPNN